MKKLLPISALEQASHGFKIVRHKSKDPRLRCRIALVGAKTLSPFQILAAHEPDLSNYRVTQAEIAFNGRANSIYDIRKLLKVIIGMLGKGRHQRHFLRSVHEPDKEPTAGHLSEPTFYLEDRKSGVKLKCYARHEKLSGGAFGALCVRIEWTLTGKAALTRHLGGNQIKDLLAADLNAFLKRNLRLEQIDHVAFGNLFCWTRSTTPRSHDAATGGAAPPIKERWRDQDYRAERAAFLVLRRLAYREYGRGRFASWEDALLICQNSPAQIRGYLRELRDGKRHRSPGRPKIMPRTNRTTITDYKINACLRAIQLQ